MSVWNPAFRLVLASGSAARRRLLASAGLPFEAAPPDLDERATEAAVRDRSPTGVSLALARAKALAVERPGALVLGADQVLSIDGTFVHKSPTRAAALASLERLGGRTHLLTSAFALARDGEIIAEDTAGANMTMRPLDRIALDRYLDAAGEGVFGSVGVYQWESLGAHLFSHAEGDHATILGLPMLKLLAALRRLGALEF